MNKYTTEIMEMFSVDAATALKIQARMEENGIDYSECTLKEFRYAAREARTQVLSKLRWNKKRGVAAESACGRFYIIKKCEGYYAMYDTRNRLAGGRGCDTLGEAQQLAERIAS